MKVEDSNLSPGGVGSMAVPARPMRGRRIRSIANGAGIRQRLVLGWLAVTLGGVGCSGRFLVAVAGEAEADAQGQRFMAQLYEHLQRDYSCVQFAFGSTDLLQAGPGLPPGAVVHGVVPAESEPRIDYVSISGDRFFLSRSPGGFDVLNYDKLHEDVSELCAGRWAGGRWARASYPNTVDLFLGSRSLSLFEDFPLSVLHLGLPNVIPTSVVLRGGRIMGRGRVMTCTREETAWEERPFVCAYVPGSQAPRVQWGFEGDEGRSLITYTLPSADADAAWPPTGYRVDVVSQGTTNGFFEVRIHDFRVLAVPLEESSFDIARRINTNTIGVMYDGPQAVKHITAAGTRTIYKSQAASPITRMVFSAILAVVTVGLPLTLIYRWFRKGNQTKKVKGTT